MECRTKIVAPSLLEEYRQILTERPDAELPLVVTGNSMRPFLRPGRDTVWLTALKAEPRRGDILLYRRGNGQYVLHRVRRVRAGELTMLGDAQLEEEPGIRRAQVLATVSRAERAGKAVTPGCPVWEFFRRCWLWLGLRRWITRIYKLRQRIC